MRYSHQKEVRSRAETGNCCLFHDCGVGKTLTALDIIADEIAKGNAPCLVVAPIRLIHDAWMSDAAKFHPGLDIQAVYHKNPKKRKEQLYADHEVQVTNPETFKNHFTDIQAKKYRVLFKDESSDLKSNTSQNTRATLAVAGFKNRAKDGKSYDHSYVIPVRHALTATPAPNQPSEYWAQIKFCTGPGNQVFSDNFYSFRGRFFYSIDLGNKRKKWIFRKDMFDEFCHKLAEIAHVHRKCDMPGLPAQHHKVHDITLGSQEQAAYDKLKKDLVIRFADETVLATTALTEIMKLRQISSGFIYGEKETHLIGSTKADYMFQLLKGVSDQHIIWINFRQEAEALKHLHGSELLIGSIPLERQMDIIKDFKAGNLQHIIANQQSISHGLTFINSWDATYFSQNYSYELMKQSRDRQHRIGAIHDCNYNYLLAKGTVDNIVYRANLAKEAMVNKFLACLVDIQNGTQPDTTGCNTIFNTTHTQMIKRGVMGHLKGKE